MRDNLYDASMEWANRPADERFWSLEDLRDKTAVNRDTDRVFSSSLGETVKAEYHNGEICLNRGMNPARLNHWSFGQVCAIAGAPAGYLRTLPGEKTVDLINYGLEKSESEDRGAMILVARDPKNSDKLVTRSATSAKYGRVWNADIIERILIPLRNHLGWCVPPARPIHGRIGDPGNRIATENDCVEGAEFGLGIHPGDEIGPAGLYAGDRDMFVFMVNPANRIDSGMDGGISRGFFLRNSEVGAAAISLTMFHYEHVCGNHIVWGATEVKDVRFVHKGRTVFSRAANEIADTMREVADESPKMIEAKIVSARETMIAEHDEDVVNVAYEKLDIPRAVLQAGFEIAQRDEDRRKTLARSAWGLFSGVTEASQKNGNMDDRIKVDRAAAKILDIAW